jgi:hypothetical protein
MNVTAYHHVSYSMHSVTSSYKSVTLNKIFWNNIKAITLTETQIVCEITIVYAYKYMSMLEVVFFFNMIWIKQKCQNWNNMFVKSASHWVQHLTNMLRFWHFCTFNKDNLWRLWVNSRMAWTKKIEFTAHAW